MLVLHSLSPTAHSAVISAVVPSAQLAAMPVTLAWAVVVLVFGVLLMVCVLVLLRREARPTYQWGAQAGPENYKGPYLHHLHRVLRAIRTMNSLIVAERNGGQLLRKACRSLTTTRGYRMAWVGVVEEGTKRVRPVSQAGFEQGYLEQVVITWDDGPTGRGPTGRAIRSGEPAVMRDIETAPDYEPWRRQALARGYRSSAALPLRFRGQVLGTLNVYSEMPDAFDIEEVGLLQEVADHLAYALGSIRLESELESARRQMLEAEHVRTAFEHAPMGIMVTDADGIITRINRRMLELLDGLEAPGKVVQRLPISKLMMFNAAAARACIERVLRQGQPAQFEWQAAVGGRSAGKACTLSCRGVPVIKQGKGVTEAVWLVDETSAQPAVRQGQGRT